MSVSRVLSLLVLLLLPAVGVSQGLPVGESAPLDAFVQYVEDPKGELGIESVRQLDLDWQDQGTKSFNQGYSSSVWWLRLTLTNDSTEAVQRHVELSYAVLDYVDVYVFSNGELVSQYEMGDKHPFYDRPVEHRFFVAPLSWDAGQTLELYYRIKTSTAVQAPLTLWEPGAFENRENSANIAQGLYYGAMGVIAIYNLLIFLMLWERSYFYYVTFVISLPMFVASISGQAYHYVWPEAVAWNDHSIPFFLSLAFGSSALFARRFLQVREWSYSLHLGLSGVALLALSTTVVSFFVPYKYSIHFLVPLGLFACVFEMLVGLMALYRKVPNSRYYVIAWLFFLSGGVLLALNKLNVIPTNFLTEYSVQIGSVMEAVLLSFALAERINTERRLRFAAQDEALQVTRRLNEELEERVLERTRELEKLNVRLQEMSNTDQLTQLKNRRYLEEVMEQEWARCKRYGHDFAIMMMDVDFFKKVNDEYGHPAGDACLQQVADRINRSIRWPSDQLARYGGEEFCLVLPETGVDGARVVAERIRVAVESLPIETETEKFNVTLSIGVCVGVPSEDGVHSMLKSADLALYQSKDSGRNRVTLMSQDQVGNVVHLPVGKAHKE